MKWGHGLTALLLGGRFHELQIFANGSGFAVNSGGFWIGNTLGQALVAAGGLMGPPLVGALFMYVARKPKLIKTTFLIFISILILSLVIWIRNIWGWITIGAITGILTWIYKQNNFKVLQFTIQLLGIQAIISTFQQLDYLFMHSAYVGGSMQLSDTGQIQKQLWATLLVLGSHYCLFFSIYFIC